MDDLVAVQIVDSFKDRTDDLRGFVIWEINLLLLTIQNQLRQLSTAHQLHSKENLPFDFFELIEKQDEVIYLILSSDLKINSFL